MRRINETESQCTKCGLVVSPTGETLMRRLDDLSWVTDNHDDEKEDFIARQKRDDKSRGRVQEAYQVAGLTKRQRDIFKLESLGLGQQEIATELGMSQPAVSQAMAAMRAKFKKVDLPRQAPDADNDADGRDPRDNRRYDQRHNGKSMAIPTLDMIGEDK